MNRINWTERKFSFDLPLGWLHNILERLHGTHARISELCSVLTEKEAEFTPNGKWSIKEHIGHLADLEVLHEGRIDDFITRKEILRAADMSNQKTVEANHNSLPLSQLISVFSKKRNHFIRRLQELDEGTQAFSSIHPRLNTPMRPVDMAYFTAEHDDHHLTTIREIIENKILKITPLNSLVQFEIIESLAEEIMKEFYAPFLPHEHVVFYLKKFCSVAAMQQQANEGYEFYLLEYLGMNAGYLAIQLKGQTLVLSKLYLLQAFRNKKIGDKAMQFIFKKAGNKANCIELIVNQQNQRAINFYERYGFRITEPVIHRFENGHSIEDYKMNKELSIINYKHEEK